MAGSDYDFHPNPGGKAPAPRLIIEKPGLELRHWTLPAATFKSDGLPVHHVAVQVSSGIHFDQRIERQTFTGPLPMRSSSVTPAGASSSTTWNRQRECLVLSLVPSLVDRLLEEDSRGTRIELAPRITGSDPFIADVMHLMARYGGDAAPFSALLLDGLTVSLVAYLAHQTMTQETPKLKSGLTRWQLQRVLDFIEDHLGEDVSLAALAGETGLSERYFCTAFRTTVGMPPYRYMMERRIARAKSLLQHQRALRITDVAMAVGFQTSTHFATTFRNLTGLTPSSFRSSRD